MKITISKDIFEKFPGYRRGLVIANAIRNGTSPVDLLELLKSAENRLYELVKPEDITSHPKIESWREAYRSLGIKPADFRPSVEALARRVLKKDPLPSINRIVDIGNLVSVQHLVPVGAHAIDLLEQDMQLRLATGSEVFEPFGSDQVENPKPGEIIFAEGDTVLTRRWTWRQAKHTLVLPATNAVEINVDALPIVSDEELDMICQQLARLTQKYCGGSLRLGILSAENPSLDL
ncbi:MAG TPA: phenylalanine--tRNA ligase beta subunit-related protein [Anaerolineales bacterium]|jgi:DNA/RNA-binding domain of Phe-tRNA-synthetase-like protein